MGKKRQCAKKHVKIVSEEPIHEVSRWEKINRIVKRAIELQITPLCTKPIQTEQSLIFNFMVKEIDG